MRSRPQFGEPRKRDERNEARGRARHESQTVLYSGPEHDVTMGNAALHAHRANANTKGKHTQVDRSSIK